MEEHGAGGLEAEHLDREAAPSLRHEREGNRLHAADLRDRCTRLVGAHDEGGGCICDEMVACIVRGTEASQQGDAVAGDLDACFCERRPQNVEGVSSVGESGGERGKFTRIEVEQACRGRVG